MRFLCKCQDVLCNALLDEGRHRKQGRVNNGFKVDGLITVEYGSTIFQFPLKKLKVKGPFHPFNDDGNLIDDSFLQNLLLISSGSVVPVEGKQLITLPSFVISKDAFNVPFPMVGSFCSARTYNALRDPAYLSVHCLIDSGSISLPEFPMFSHG